MNSQALESFVDYCDDMMIAEEGFKDAVKTGAGKAASGAKFIGGKIVQFIKMLRDLIRRVIDRIKGIKKETKVDSDKYFYLTKINKVRMQAVIKTLKNVQAAHKSNEDISDITVELKKCNKVDEKWAATIANRKSKMIPTNPSAIAKILNDNNGLLKQCESALNFIEAKANVQSGVSAPNAAPLYSAINSCLQLVQKTIKQANGLVSSNGKNDDMVNYGSKHSGKDPKMTRRGKAANKRMGAVNKMG